MPALAIVRGTAEGVNRQRHSNTTEIVPTFRARAQVDRPLAVVNAVNTTPVTWYVHVDHLNRPIKMTDGAKVSVWDATWLPWGNVHAITGSAVLDARFPGQWFQLETGLHYNWNRSYDPTLGRYTQPDPLGFVDGPSVYGYARGKPQSLADSDGLNPAGYCIANPSTCAAAAVIAAQMARQAAKMCVRAVVKAITPGSPQNNCTPDQHRDLQDRVENACGSATSCNGGDSVASLSGKIGGHSSCIDARRRINETCFSGGDSGHTNAISERQNAINRCQSLISQIGGGAR